MQIAGSTLRGVRWLPVLFGCMGTACHADGSGSPGADASPADATSGGATSTGGTQGTGGTTTGNGSGGTTLATGGFTGTGSSPARDAGVDGRIDGATSSGGARSVDASTDGSATASDASADGAAASDAGPDASGIRALRGPSCDGLPKTCGANGTDDCCESSVVTGGPFVRDNGVNGSYPATVSDFRLDKYEVTVGRFRKFIEAYPASTPANASGMNTNVAADPGWDTAWSSASALPANQAAFVAAVECTNPVWQNYTVGDDNLPMNCIDWYEAYAFCIWDGGRLPTELEWNYAAAGGKDQRPYPWSTSPTDKTISPSYAVYAPAAAVYADVGSTSPLGDGRWGQADLAGNVMEWVEDWKAPYPATCADCAFVDDKQILSQPYRMTRGGSAGDDSSFQLTSTRWYWNAPSFRTDVIGVRCARNVEGKRGDAGAD